MRKREALKIKVGDKLTTQKGSLLSLRCGTVESVVLSGPEPGNYPLFKFEEDKGNGKTYTYLHFENP